MSTQELICLMETRYSRILVPRSDVNRICTRCFKGRFMELLRAFLKSKATARSLISRPFRAAQYCICAKHEKGTGQFFLSTCAFTVPKKIMCCDLVNCFVVKENVSSGLNVAFSMLDPFSISLTSGSVPSENAHTFWWLQFRFCFALAPTHSPAVYAELHATFYPIRGSQLIAVEIGDWPTASPTFGTHL